MEWECTKSSNSKSNLRQKNSDDFSSIHWKSPSINPLKIPILHMAHKSGLSVFIVDDEPNALKQLADDLRQQPEIAEVRTFSNYTEATLPMLEIQPDVLFLDVEVPGKTGLEFLESIRPKVNFTFRVVFYSAFSDYMLDAIRHSAFDFLLKPYKPEELRTVLNRLTDVPETDVNLFASPSPDAMPRKMAVQTVSELLLLTPEQLLMFNYNSSQRSWQLTLTDRTNHMLRKTTSAEDLLALHPSLVRVSNTSIINLNYLAAVENCTQKCRLCPPFSDIELMASRRYFSKLKEFFEML